MQELWTDTNTQMELALFDRPFGEGKEQQSTWWEELTKKVGKREAWGKKRQGNRMKR